MKKRNYSVGILVAILIFGITCFFCATQINKAYALDTTGPKAGSFGNITSLFVPEVTVNPGEKVEVDLYGDNSLKVVSVTFRSTTSSDSFVAYLANLPVTNIHNKAYFIVPDTVKRGERYEMTHIWVFGGENYSVAEGYETKQGSEYPYMNVGNEKYINIASSDTNSVELKSFSLKNDTIKLEDEVYANIDYNGYVDWISFGLTHKETGQVLLRSIWNTEKDLTSNWTKNVGFTLKGGSPSGIIGEYEIDSIILCVTDSGCKVYKNVVDGSSEAIQFEIRDTLKVVDEQENKINLNKLTLTETTATIGEKVNVSIDSSNDLESILLSFYNTADNKTMTAYVKSLDSNPYFVIPSTTTAGIYDLEYAILTDKAGNSTYYRKGENSTNSVSFDFNSQIEIISKEVDKSLMTFNNEDYNLNVIEEIKNLDENAIITVIADSNTILDKTLFESIYETKRTLIVEYKDSEWVFNGTDIINPKSIDVSLMLESISDENVYNDLIVKELSDNSLMLNFSDNGQLPGKVLIRLKSSKLDEIFKDEEIFVYYYDEDNDNLLKVALEVQKVDGYYEFYINHNSKYILSNKKLEGSYVSNEEKLLEMNSLNIDDNSNNNNNYIYIISAVGIILVIGIIVFIVCKKKK